MQFADSDIDAILAVTGDPVIIQLSGATMKTIQGKFRKNFEDISPYEASVGLLRPVLMCKTSDLAGIGNAYSFVIQGTEYKFDGKPEDQPSGFTRVRLGLKV